MFSKAEVMQCSHATLMADNAIECKNSLSRDKCFTLLNIIFINRCVISPLM